MSSETPTIPTSTPGSTPTPINQDNLSPTTLPASSSPLTTDSPSFPKIAQSPANMQSKSAKQPKPKIPWRASKPFIISVVFLGIFVDLCIYSIIIPILPFIVANLNGTSTLTGLLIAIFGLGILIAAPLFGYLADKYNNKRIPMIVSLGALLASTLLFMVSGSYVALIGARFLQGAASAGVWVLGVALIADAFHDKPEDLGKGISVVLAGFTLGQVVGPPLGGALFEISYYAPFIFCCGLVLLDLIGRLLVIEPSHVPELSKESSSQSLEMGELSVVQAQDSEAELVLKVESLVEKRNEEPVNGFLPLLKNKQMLILCALIAVAATGLAGLEPTLPLFLASTYSLSILQIGLVFLSIVIPAAITAPIAGWLYDKYGPKPCLYTGFILCMIVYPFVGISGSLVWTCIGLFLLGVIETIAITPLMPEVAKIVPRNAYAKAYSINNIAFSLGVVLGPLICGGVYEKVGWFWQMVFLAGTFVVGMPLIYVYEGEKKKLGEGEAVVL
ncbi:hypothetical protein HDV05_004001 [Chytridiales sp. JEL 0842]|nr:hypothetical protein HDV05_004001 [Chytridiales sp. JEL 0842]